MCNLTTLASKLRGSAGGGGRAAACDSQILPLRTTCLRPRSRRTAGTRRARTRRRLSECVPCRALPSMAASRAETRGQPPERSGIPPAQAHLSRSLPPGCRALLRLRQSLGRPGESKAGLRQRRAAVRLLPAPRLPARRAHALRAQREAALLHPQRRRMVLGTGAERRLAKPHRQGSPRLFPLSFPSSSITPSA